jgi:hypothetical protein
LLPSHLLATGFDYSGPFILTIVRVLYRDVPYFLAFYLIVVVAFASAIAMLVNYGDPDINYGFKKLVFTFWTLLRDTVSQQFFGTMVGPDTVDVKPYLLLLTIRLHTTSSPFPLRTGARPRIRQRSKLCAEGIAVAVLTAHVFVPSDRDAADAQPPDRDA